MGILISGIKVLGTGTLGWIWCRSSWTNGTGVKRTRLCRSSWTNGTALWNRGLDGWTSGTVVNRTGLWNRGLDGWTCWCRVWHKSGMTICVGQEPALRG